MTNDFLKELKDKGVDAEVVGDDVLFIKNEQPTKISIDKIRRIFLNSILSHLDNL